MADKSVGELIAAQSVTPTDLFVLEQNGTAKKLTGQTLENWLVSFADGHGGIQSIVKHSTSGLKDTYRITLADTTTFDFIVTNGKAISSVEQTSEEGLTRTYTIAFNDNTSQTFTVTDGRSITNIEKTATNVLTDTYTISYNDGTTSTFTVKNGKGISSFAKVSTVGLIDTYRIEYNDGTSDEFTVTNGAKGDKGDNQYVWIKYASQKPTASSHSFGDVADNWIGIYSGASATAPTDWTQYEWFQWKGENGDTGEPAVRLSVTTAYQVGDAGNIIPSGSWLPSIPYVAPGKYLWIRKTTVWNKGDPDVDYSVSRMGIDGSGAVSTVAGVGPDANGNVPLTAADVKALSIGGDIMEGPINMNGHLIKGLNAPTESDQAANMGFVNEQVKKAAPYNYAHNSDFTQWVATKGIGGLHGVHAYAGDRWILDDGIVTGDAREDGNGYRNIKLNGTIRQKVANAPDVANAAIEMISGTASISYNNGEIVITSSGGIIKNVLLCADETLPKYQPKGYGAELAECQRYYIKLGAETVCPGYTGSDGKQVWFHILLPTTMRVTPTAVHSGGLGLRNINGPYNLSSYTIVSTIQSNNGVVIAIDQTETQLPPGVTCNVYIIGSMELLADIPENL